MLMEMELLQATPQIDALMHQNNFNAGPVRTSPPTEAFEEVDLKDPMTRDGQEMHPPTFPAAGARLDLPGAPANQFRGLSVTAHKILLQLPIPVI